MKFLKKISKIFNLFGAPCVEPIHKTPERMALAIRNTPVLKGEASRRFNEIKESSELITVSKQRIEHINSLTEKVLAKLKK